MVTTARQQGRPEAAPSATPPSLISALVVHPGALGDVLLAVPALRALRRESRQLTLVAQPRIGALLLALGVVDDAVSFDSFGLDALFTDATVPENAPFVRHLSAASRVVCWFGARDRGFADRLRALSPEAVVAAPAAPPTPVWRHLLATVGNERAEQPPVVVRAPVRDDADRVLRAAGWDGRSRVVVVHPGAGGSAKRWPPGGFVDVLADVEATVVVHQGPADADAVDAVLAQTTRPMLRLVNPPLETLAGLLAEASVFLGNDSGVSHFAAAVGAPSLVLFTTAMLPWTPWSPTAQCLPVTTARVIDAERTMVRAALRAML